MILRTVFILISLIEMSVENEQDVLPCRLGSDTNSYISDCGEPPTKRARKSSTDKSSVTILDVLEVDICCRAILDNLRLSEILRTECVCQRWRDSVLHYIRDSTRFRRPLYLSTPSLEWIRGSRSGIFRCPLTLEAVRGGAYERALYKWGKGLQIMSCVVDSFPIVAEHCPNLQHLVVYGIPKQDVISEHLEKLGKLEKVVFKKPLDSHTEVVELNPDDAIRIFLQKNSIKQLSVIDNNLLTGSCFNKSPTNLTNLRLESCPALDYREFLTLNAPELRTLELSRVPVGILENVHVLLDKMPDLEGLELANCDQEVDFQWRVLEKLVRLKRLSFCRNDSATDDWLAAVAGRDVKYLDISYCDGVSLDGLYAFCNPSGLTLEHLGLAGRRRFSHSDAEFTIRLCRNLWVLDARDCLGLTSELVPYLGHILRRRGRRRLPRLTLRLRGTAVTETPAQMRHLNRHLILDFSDDKFSYDSS